MADDLFPPVACVAEGGADGVLQLCTLAELAATGCREFRIGGGDWPLRGFVVRVGQSVRAYVNRCPHQRYRLNFLPDDLLTDDGRYILCAMHDALFEKNTGLCVSGPCLGRSLSALPIEVDAGRVLLVPGTDVRTLVARFA